MMRRVMICFFIFFTFQGALAATGGGIGDFANTLMSPTQILLGFVKVASTLIGLLCLFGSIVLYMQHRVNPMMSPWSSIILVFLIGIILLGLPYFDKIFHF